MDAIEVQYLTQENHEQRTINLQYQRLIKTILNRNSDFKKENDDLKKENEELIGRINRLDERMKKNQSNIPIYNNHTVSRDYRDIRYFQADGLNRSTPTDTTLASRVNDFDSNQNEIITLKEENSRLMHNYNNLETKYETNKRELDSWKTRAAHLKQKLTKCEKNLHDFQNARLQDLSKDPRFMNNLSKEKNNRIEELEKQNEVLQARIQKDQEKNHYDFANIKKEKIDTCFEFDKPNENLEEDEDEDEDIKPFRAQPPPSTSDL